MDATEIANLEAMKRADLQKLCKAAGIKANGKNAEMIESLRQYYEDQASQPSGSNPESMAADPSSPSAATEHLADALGSVKTKTTRPRRSSSASGILSVSESSAVVDAVLSALPEAPIVATVEGLQSPKRRSSGRRVSATLPAPIAAAPAPSQIPAPKTPVSVFNASSVAAAPIVSADSLQSAATPDMRRATLIEHRKQKRLTQLKTISKTKSEEAIQKIDKTAGENRPHKQVDIARKFQEAYERDLDRTIARMQNSRKAVTKPKPFNFATPKRAAARSDATTPAAAATTPAPASAKKPTGATLVKALFQETSVVDPLPAAPAAAAAKENAVPVVTKPVFKPYTGKVPKPELVGSTFAVTSTRKVLQPKNDTDDETAKKPAMKSKALFKPTSTMASREVAKDRKAAFNKDQRKDIVMQRRVGAIHA